MMTSGILHILQLATVSSALLIKVTRLEPGRVIRPGLSAVEISPRDDRWRRDPRVGGLRLQPIALLSLDAPEGARRDSHDGRKGNERHDAYQNTAFPPQGRLAGSSARASRVRRARFPEDEIMRTRRFPE